MTGATSSTNGMKPISLTDLKRVMREIDLLPKNTEWVLLSPDGRVWKGNPMELFQVLMPHHPLFNQITPPVFTG